MKALLVLMLLLTFFGGTYSGDAAASYYCSPRAARQTLGTEPGPTYVSCTCLPGNSGNGISCYSMASCTTARCCVPGSTTWSTAMKRCMDVNECSSDTLNMCAPKASCINLNTNYVCSSNRSLECSPGETCGDNTDCVKKNGIYSCADPCDSGNHGTIDGSTRLSSTTSTGVFQTDSLLHRSI
ncbi:hypothetical protein NDU88_001557 [Pleurodeles waltl]|uniref:Uncharacterized protein n=1 Tax=Pleurodeles waltl TaxID=8319 RepID=A0AAV7TI11_PLEWA|nr:hypothetical protein NDU88_001557 [Pleurodeles waltl]